MDIKDLRTTNDKYWINRAEGYSKVNQEELAGEQKRKWADLLTKIISINIDKEPGEIKILDIGAGPGFISIILTEAGFSVTAADYAYTMIEEAKSNAGYLAEKINFVKEDAMNLSFGNEEFDLVVSRNLTWNLPDPEKAYSEWIRVLKKGGLLINFDSNWYTYLFDDEKRKGYEEDRRNVADANYEDYNIGENFDLMEDIALNLPLSNVKRPEWDVKVLTKLGMEDINTTEDIGQFVYSEKELINYASTPLFMVLGKKGDTWER